MDARENERRGGGPWRGWLSAVLALASLGAGGCGGTFWDTVTRRDFTMAMLYSKPDPLIVLRDSKDADDRARAIRGLREPLQNGGNQKDQDLIVQVLTTAAKSDRQVVCRMAAISSLRHFKDPRAIDGLKDAYYAAGSFSPDTATILRCQSIDALGATGQPAAVELLVKVLKEPPVEGATADKQQKMDERIAAARALGHFKEYQATAALADVLKTDQDVALRSRATEALSTITGKKLPAEYQPWADFLNAPGNKDAIAHGQTESKGIDLISWWWK